MRQLSFRAGLRASIAAALSLLVVSAMVVMPVSASANEPGSSMYTRSSTTERLAYSRVIRLQHSGNQNGTLLGSFEHATTDGTPSDFVIRRSTDDGATWTTLTTVGDPLTGVNHPSDQFWQPFLYEFPRRIGAFPAGTLVLLGNMAPSEKVRTDFVLWRSRDHGASWTFQSIVQTGGGSIGAPHGGSGVWEPFLTLNGAGQLAMYFSDERTEPARAQVIAHIVSNDGGVTWSANPDGSTNFAPGLVIDVEGSDDTARPGMPTVATLPDGPMVLAYEVCGIGRNCEAHTKISTDGGNTWGTGPTDLGRMAVTSDHRYLGSSPYVVWTPAGGPDGELLLTGMRTRLVGSNAFTPEDRQAIFVSTDRGASWSWMPAPFQPVTASAKNCSASYSPDLLLSRNGRSVRETTASAVDGTGCMEGTAVGGVGILPWSSSFTTGQGGWINYGGCWTTTGSVLAESCGGSVANKALTGSTGWTDYTLRGDVRADNGGQAGFVVRASNPSVGTDALHGYYAGLTRNGIVLGREGGAWTELGRIEIPGGIAASAWYHFTIAVRGCTITVAADRDGDSAPAVHLERTDTGCTATSGSIGVRDLGGTAAWRNLTVTPAGS